MVSVTLLLHEAEVAGLRLTIDGERLIVRGPRSARALAEALLGLKHEVLAALAADQPTVRWRVEAMREQLPRSGPLPFLGVRPIPRDPRHCRSCGDPLTPDPGRFSVRCRPCTHAAQLITTEYANHATDTRERRRGEADGATGERGRR